MFELVTSIFKNKKDFKIQSFTFFLPSPPPRATGYREKQFDKIFYEFINKGYKILNFTTQAQSSGEKQSGMWILVVVQATNSESEKLNLDEIFHDSIKAKAPVKDSIDGFYYIDDRTPDND